MDGFVTMQAEFRTEGRAALLQTPRQGNRLNVLARRPQVRAAGFVWGALRRVLPEGACEGTEQVRSMRLTADGHGAVFDVSDGVFAEVTPILGR